MSSDGPAPNTNDAEAVRSRAAACQALVDRFVNESLNPAEFLRLLRETGATAAESADYVKQAKDLRDSAMELNRTQPNSREATPEGLSEEEVSKFRKHTQSKLNK
ncbi:hypothetical protein B0H14DRAFT_3130231 [Mycena olivaceomarginata]|nr:hypothetical protein B0H14DRAFT_3130231 [Mycena olivaceomarginata]